MTGWARFDVVGAGFEGPTGRKVFMYRYRVRAGKKKGKLQRLVLGRYGGPGGMTLSEARVETENCRAIAREHGDLKKFLEAERRANIEALEAQEKEG